MAGLNFIAAAIAIFSAGASGLGEGLVCAKAIEGISRNPEAYSKIRGTMILGCALTETTAIYALLIAILCIFMG